MRSKVLFFMRSKFSTIFDNFDQEVDRKITRSKVAKSIVSNFWSHDQSCVYKNVHEIESQKSIIFNLQSHENILSHKCDNDIVSFYA